MKIIGKYKIIRELGAGGFGAVYLAEDPNLGEKVAIKVFRIKDVAAVRDITSATGDAGEVLKKRFLDEAKILRRLSSSPHIVSMHDFDTLEDGTPYYVMPYLPRCLVDEIGRDAFTRDKLEKLEEEQYPRALPLIKTLDVLKQTLEGLKVVHKAGLVHRDIKPANLLLEGEGNLFNIVLCDFGIAKLPEGDNTGTGVGMGSPNYVSPEQRASAKYVDSRSDVFSVGVLAYRMLTGSVPLVTGNQAPKNFIPALNDELNDLVMASMEFEPEKRPRDAADFLNQLLKAEAAFSGDFDTQETSGTWQDQGQSSIRNELLPLYEKIKEAWLNDGVIDHEEHEMFSAMAAVVDLNDDDLNALITQVEQDHEKTIKPIQNFIRLIDKRIKEQIKPDQPALNPSTLASLKMASQSLSWDESKFQTILQWRIAQESSNSHSAEDEKYKAEANTQSKSAKKEKAQGDSANSSKGLLGLMILILVSSLAYGGWWYTDYQTKQTEIQEQKVLAKKIAQESEQIAWQLALSQKTAEGYQLYLDTWPQGTNKTKAENALQALAEKARIAKLSAEEQQIDQTKQAQSKLKHLGYRLAVTGKLDTRTQKAILAFEKQEKLLETGEVDTTLISALNTAIERQKTLLAKQAAKEKADAKKAREKVEAEKVAKKEAKERAARIASQKLAEKARLAKEKQEYEVLVKATQTQLNRIGYKIGEPDGSLSLITQKALTHYQKGNQLNASGAVSNKLLANLKLALAPGVTFKDCSNCPKMVIIPAGSFQMGSNESSNEQPIHRVTIAEPFAIGQYEVTWAQYQPCIDAGVCSSDGDAGFGKGNRPVIEVNWDDAQIYAKWLSKKTGKHYRLPSESEWEYAARAGTTTKYSWGDSISCSQARYGYYSGECGKQKSTDDVGAFKPNAFGLYDMHGNVYEWVQDCYQDSYTGAPSTSKAWVNGDCAKRVLRGGSWIYVPYDLRSAARYGYTATLRDANSGFRLVQGR